MAQAVEAGADDLRLAAQGVRVLHAVVAREMRAADRRAVEQRAVVLRDVDLPRLAAQLMDARVERPVAAARRVDRQRADDERGFEHRLEGEERVQRQRGRDLGAVDQREAFLGTETQRRDARLLQHVGRRPTCFSFQTFTFPDQRQGEVRQRRQVARGADRALARHIRHEAGVVHREQGVDHRLAHARGAARQRRRLEREHQPHHRGGERRADADAVRADQVELQAFEPGGIDALAGELAEARVDAIDRRAALRRALHHGRAGAHPLARRLADDEPHAAGVDRLQLVERDRAGTELHYPLSPLGRGLG